MKSNGKKDNENTSDGITTVGEKGVKLNGSSAVECELLPILGCFQPNSSRSFKSFVICSPALSRSHAETLQNHYDEVVKRGRRHNQLQNFPLCSTDSASCRPTLLSYVIVYSKMEIANPEAILPGNSMEGVGDCSGMHSLLKWDLRPSRASSSQFSDHSFTLQTIRTVLKAMFRKLKQVFSLLAVSVLVFVF